MSPSYSAFFSRCWTVAFLSFCSKSFPGHIEDDRCHAVSSSSVPANVASGTWPRSWSSRFHPVVLFVETHFTFSFTGWVPRLALRESLLWFLSGAATERSPVLWGASQLESCGVSLNVFTVLCNCSLLFISLVLLNSYTPSPFQVNYDHISSIQPIWGKGTEMATSSGRERELHSMNGGDKNCFNTDFKCLHWLIRCCVHQHPQQFPFTEIKVGSQLRNLLS